MEQTVVVPPIVRRRVKLYCELDLEDYESLVEALRTCRDVDFDNGRTVNATRLNRLIEAFELSVEAT